MKTIILTFFLSFSMLIGFAQEKTKQQLKEEKKLAKQKEVEALVDSKEFEFQATMAYPQGTRSIDMTTNSNFLRFEKDTIHSEMPYFGRAYSGVGYGGSGGLDFKGPIQNYSIAKDKKSYIIKAEVKDKTDLYSIVLTVFFEGNASLTINTSNRSMISYRGSIDKFVKK
ncbi:DUF4251 domain-containing protein [Flavobacterium taihuense]|uniref:DUF4251 domain-containing protein n=1 Tax=Flavobacterium taihuense TaxID=2857508 RepID=A0ABS6Y0Y7_9FLAO|nr:DUF4251 domain-containing protein [Flavobacterium taihuense]MBW4362529.1 DUF4251 domain-containing protein [Flavobacterium taihuense]